MNTFIDHHPFLFFLALLFLWDAVVEVCIAYRQRSSALRLLAKINAEPKETPCPSTKQ